MGESVTKGLKATGGGFDSQLQQTFLGWVSMLSLCVWVSGGEAPVSLTINSI